MDALPDRVIRDELYIGMLALNATISVNLLHWRPRLNPVTLFPLSTPSVDHLRSVQHVYFHMAHPYDLSAGERDIASSKG